MKVTPHNKMKTLKILLLSLIFTTAFSLSSSAALKRIMFAPATSVVSVGETFEINIALDSGVVDLFAYTVHVKYDSSIVRIIDAYPTSEWLALSGSDQYFVGADSVELIPGTNDTNWYYHVFDVLFTFPKKTIDGYAEIATLKFEAKQTGISTVYYEFQKGSDTLLNSIISYTADGFVYVCPLSFIPGDMNGDDEVDISDLVHFVDYSFRDGPPPLPVELAGDMDCDNEVDIADLVYMVDYQFRDGPPPCDHCL